MRFLDFKRQFRDFNAITHQDIQNAFGAVNQSQLVAWKKKGYITAARKGVYVLTESTIDPLLLAQEMNDSYISLEFALAHYQIIPEIVPVITAVSSSRSEEVVNDFGNFHYHKIAPKLFCGFVLMESAQKHGRFVRIAEREKALFDLVYFRSDLKSAEDFAALRLHIDNIDCARIQMFIDLVRAPQIKKRLNNFVAYLHARVS